MVDLIVFSTVRPELHYTLTPHMNHQEMIDSVSLEVTSSMLDRYQSPPKLMFFKVKVINYKVKFSEDRVGYHWVC